MTMFSHTLALAKKPQLDISSTMLLAKNAPRLMICNPSYIRSADCYDCGQRSSRAVRYVLNQVNSCLRASHRLDCLSQADDGLQSMQSMHSFPICAAARQTNCERKLTSTAASV